MLEGSQGQIWNITTLGNQFMCCHNRVLFIVENDKLAPLFTEDGVWDVALLPRNEQTALMGTYNGFYLLHLLNGEWKVSEKMSNFDHTARRFELDKKGNAWTLTPNGVDLIVLDMKYNDVQSEI